MIPVAVRAAAFTLLLFVSTAAFAQFAPAFPSAATPEIPVSPTTYGWADGNQYGVHAASNGDITLAAWTDTRSGSDQVYAARIDASGRVLDVLGVPLGINGTASDVVWSGDAFIVVAGPNWPVLISVGSDGTILGRNALSFPAQYICASGNGADVRFLFFQYGEQVVIDRSGTVVGRSTAIWTPHDGLVTLWTIGGSTPSGFIVLVQEYVPGSGPAGVQVNRYDRDGRRLGSSQTQLPFTLSGREGVYGGSDGAIVIRHYIADPSIAGYRLDGGGAYSGTIAFAPAEAGRSYVPGDLQWDGEQYVLAASSAVPGQASVTLANIAAGASTASARQVAQLEGTSTLVRGAAQPFVFTASASPAWSSGSDLFVQRFTPELTADAPKIVTASSPRQAMAHVAMTSKSYAVAWIEIGPDQFVHGYVRRFTNAGQPIDPEPLEAAHTSQIRVVASGERYAVLWDAGGKTLVRRLGDAPGSWLDSQPASIDASLSLPYSTAFAGDASGFVFATMQSTPQSSLQTQHISMTGDLTVSPPTVVASSPYPADAALASNGNGYLLVWSDGYRVCNLSPCLIPPCQLLAVRLRSDGTAIDTTRIIVEDSGAHPDMPSVAWNGGHYAVAWTDWPEIRGATVTADGIVHDVGSDGGVVLQNDPNAPTLEPTAKILPFRDGFALLTKTREVRPNGQFGHPIVWRGVAFCADCLRDVAAIPMTNVLDLDAYASGYGSLDAAGGPAGLVVAYDRPGGGDVGFVPRVVSRMFSSVPRRRAASR